MDTSTPAKAVRKAVKSTVEGAALLHCRIAVHAEVGSSSSRSLYDDRWRRYQRTANKITSAGERKPADAEGILTGGPGWGVRVIERRSPPGWDPSTQQSREDSSFVE